MRTTQYRTTMRIKAVQVLLKVVLLASIFYTAASTVYNDAVGMLCEQHLRPPKGNKGVLIRSWTYGTPNQSKTMWQPSAYLPRHKNHTYVPVRSSAPRLLENLDIFVTHTTTKRPIRSFCNLKFQRMATIYLLLHYHAKRNTKLTYAISDWERVGPVRLLDDQNRSQSSPSRLLKIGFGENVHMVELPRNAYVFKTVARNITLPSSGEMAKQIIGIPSRVRHLHWSLLVGEADGSPSHVARTPQGIQVPNGGRCPRELHELWKTKARDNVDKSIRKMMFHTYHPQRDPCYGWCAYDHEHGSDSRTLMGYTPQYDYVAYKNKRQNESNAGFKDFVMYFPEQDVHFYLSVHAKMSGSRRLSAAARFHTVTMAAVHGRSKKLALELRFKANFGERRVRMKQRGKTQPVNTADERIANLSHHSHESRIVNVIDPKRLDHDLRYRKGTQNSRQALAGLYEQWRTVPICSRSRSHPHRGASFFVDFKDMALALRTRSVVKARVNDTTRLGRYRNGKFFPSVSVNRELIVRDSFNISAEHCSFFKRELSRKGSRFAHSKDGKFYTDVFGQELHEGPGISSVAQYIEPGFSLQVHGDFMSVHPFSGLYMDGAHGRMVNIGYGVDANQN